MISFHTRSLFTWWSSGKNTLQRLDVNNPIYDSSIRPRNLNDNQSSLFTLDHDPFGQIVSSELKPSKNGSWYLIFYSVVFRSSSWVNWNGKIFFRLSHKEVSESLLIVKINKMLTKNPFSTSWFYKCRWRRISPNHFIVRKKTSSYSYELHLSKCRWCLFKSRLRSSFTHWSSRK